MGSSPGADTGVGSSLAASADIATASVQGLHSAALYVFGEKAQVGPAGKEEGGVGR